MEWWNSYPVWISLYLHSSFYDVLLTASKCPHYIRLIFLSDMSITSFAQRTIPLVAHFSCLGIFTYIYILIYVFYELYNYIIQLYNYTISVYYSCAYTYIYSGACISKLLSYFSSPNYRRYEVDRHLWRFYFLMAILVYSLYYINLN